MSSKVEWLVRAKTVGLIKVIMAEEGRPVPEAMERLFSSLLFKALEDRWTGLYLESPSCLFELYRREDFQL